MGLEEQKEEREVLDSIYPDEITDISANEFRISILLDVSEEDSGGVSEPPSLLLSVRFPESYPDTPPDLDLLAGAKHPLLELAADKPRLLAGLNETIEENIGMAMVFTLVMSLKDAAESLIRDRAEAERAERETEIRRLEEKENEKFNGTVVTQERFEEWWRRFQGELEEEKKRRAEEVAVEEKKKRAGKDEVRLTGRQLWERGLAKGDEEEEGDLDVEKLKITA